MTDWLVCSLCMNPPGITKGAFFLASCGDIFCKSCLDTGALEPVCKICNEPAKVVEINRQLKPDLQMLFLPAQEVAKRVSSTATKQLNTVLEFQTKHRSRQAKSYKAQAKKMQKMMAYFQKEMEKKADMEKCFMNMKAIQNSLMEENKMLKQRVMNLQNSLNQQQNSIQRHRMSPFSGITASATFDSSPKTPKHMDIGACENHRISIGLTGKRQSSGGTPGNRSQPRTPTALRSGISPNFSETSVTTPMLLTGCRRERENMETDKPNPYHAIWQRGKSPTSNGGFSVIPHVSGASPLTFKPSSQMPFR